MKIVGLIAEYNPFHNGHQYHIEQAKEITGADAAIVIMSGDFVQRGTPAVMSKHLRAQAALMSGADAVFELPLIYSCGSAESFASGAISLFDCLGCIDAICFGSESGDIDVLSQIAEIISDEPEEYKCYLNSQLKKGVSFPAARAYAISEYQKKEQLFELPEYEELSEILAAPNNILAIEYLKALYCINSAIEPYTILRKGTGYHAQELTAEFASASAIRHALLPLSQEEQIFATLKNQIPQATWTLYKNNYGKCFPITPDDFSLLLKYKLLSETKDSLTQYADVTDDLANRIISLRNDFQSFTQFCDIVKTKNLTYTRVSRSLMHILLRITDAILPTEHNCPYARLLGFRSDCSELLGIIKKNSVIPMFTKLPKLRDIRTTESDILSSIDDDNDFDTESLILLERDIFAANLYESVVSDKFHTPFVNEYQQQVIKYIRVPDNEL